MNPLVSHPKTVLDRRDFSCVNEYSNNGSVELGHDELA